MPARISSSSKAAHSGFVRKLLSTDISNFKLSNYFIYAQEGSVLKVYDNSGSEPTECSPLSFHENRFRSISYRSLKSIIIDGKEGKFSTPRQATDSGIGTVYQDLALNALTSVTRNFFLGREIKKGPGAFGIMQMKEMDKITTEEMSKIGIEISDPTQAVGTMSGGQRQTLAIARAIYFGAKILILDEPTSALGQKQQMEVLKTIKRVQKLGHIAIILITHNEIHARLIADRYTFLSLGEVIGKGLAEELGGDDIKKLMAGGTEIGDLRDELGE